jgi:light-regulated signal transduction histidine kinase (bacteriophytochrome)
VDLNDIIGQVEHDLELLILEKQAVIRQGRLPAIEGAGILLYQLFYNLINNALKFSREEPAPLIQIQAASHNREGSAFTEITVTDNGIGFNNKYNQKIFQAFSRLNSKDDYEGTGLGLALCQKIVERHGGLITSSGTEGGGATFTIILPLQQTGKTVQNLLSRIQ